MRRRTWKNLLTFILVLVLTAVTVSALSMATAAKTETAPARYSQQVREAQASAVTQLSAAVPAEELSPLVSVSAFGAILAVPAGGLLLWRSSRRKGRAPAASQGRRRYSPRADMAFQNK